MAHGESYAHRVERLLTYPYVTDLQRDETGQALRAWDGARDVLRSLAEKDPRGKQMVAILNGTDEVRRESWTTHLNEVLGRATRPARGRASSQRRADPRRDERPERDPRTAGTTPTVRD